MHAERLSSAILLWAMHHSWQTISSPLHKVVWRLERQFTPFVILHGDGQVKWAFQLPTHENSRNVEMNCFFVDVQISCQVHTNLALAKSYHPLWHDACKVKWKKCRRRCKKKTLGVGGGDASEARKVDPLRWFVLLQLKKQHLRFSTSLSSEKVDQARRIPKEY